MVTTHEPGKCVYGKARYGVGLAVVHGIINNYGGAVEVESTVTKGSCFYIYLPEAK